MLMSHAPSRTCALASVPDAVVTSLQTMPRSEVETKTDNDDQTDDALIGSKIHVLSLKKQKMPAVVSTTLRSRCVVEAIFAG